MLLQAHGGRARRPSLQLINASEARDSRRLVGAEVAPKTDGSLDDGLPLGFDALKN
jgi:hypothetical protein